MSEPRTERTTARRVLVDRIVEELAPRMRARAEAMWELATTGETSAAERLVASTMALDRVLSDADLYLSVRRSAQDGPVGDVQLDRSIVLLEMWMAPKQGDAVLRAEVVAKEAELQRIYTTFRGSVDGEPRSVTDIARILDTSDDVGLRRKAWEASQQVGAEVRDRVVELVELRNQVARGLGHRDHYAMALALQELSEEKLFATLGKLEKATRTPYRTRKAVHDAEVSRQFGVTNGGLMPWHYSNPFFQSVAAPRTLELTQAYAEADLEEIATRFYDGLGMNTRPILARSDLQPRTGKDEHAFSLVVDRAARDVRVLANLRQAEPSMATLLHELGHATYDRYIEQPWLLRRPAHTLMTEAIAMLMGRQSTDVEFLLEYLGLPAFEVTPLSGEIRRFQCFRMQTFTRWSLVVTHFERELYADPRRADLDRLWWELKSKFQLVDPPPGRDAPDWAAKRHLALSPVYYHNYIYGELVASQLRHVVLEQARTNSLVDSLFAGEFLIEEVFAHGASKRWDVLLEQATGEPLNPQHFVREFTT